MTRAKATMTEGSMTIQRLVGQRIHAFSNMISGHFYQRTEQPTGVPLPEWRVLRSVIHAPGLSQGEVAVNQGLNVMNVSRAVAGLRRKGLIEVRTDEQDRRRTLLHPTSLGEEVGADIGERERVMYDHVFSVLTGDELHELDVLLGRVNELLSSGKLPEPPPATSDWARVLRENSEES